MFLELFISLSAVTIFVVILLLAVSVPILVFQYFLKKVRRMLNIDEQQPYE